jgi:hypothetical protein
MKLLEISKVSGYVFPALVHVVDSSGVAVTTATVTCELYNGANTAQKLDWSDKTFKTSGWTTGALALTHIANGVYFAAGSFDQGAGAIAFSDGQYLLMIPTITPASGPAIPGESEVWRCSQDTAAAMHWVNKVQTFRNGAVLEERVHDNQGTLKLTRLLKGPDGTTEVATVAADALAYAAKAT